MKQIIILLLASQLAMTLQSMAQPDGKCTADICTKPARSGKLKQGEHIAFIKGLKVHYYVEGNGPVCLFPSPGWGAAVDYARHMKPLVDHFTMVFYDTRGSGQSSGPEDYIKYSAPYFTNDMDALRNYLGQDKVWIAGHSGGGFQVLRYGIYFSDHLNGIIAIGAAAYFDSVYANETTRLIQLRSAADPYYTPERISIFMGTDPSPAPIGDQLMETLGFYFHDLDKMRYFPPNVSFSDRVYDFTSRAGLFSENLLPDLSKITVPVLVIAGDDDIVCNVASQSVRIYQGLRKGSLAVLNNCGHIPWIEQPALFSAACENWLKEVQQPTQK